MIICPDCAQNISAEQNCQHCGWELDKRNDFFSYLSSINKKDNSFNNYLENYDAICQDDLTNSIQDPRYLRIQSKKLYSYLGKLQGLHVCEVGIGQGSLFDQMISSGVASLTAIDISTPYLQKIKDRINGSVNTSLIVANAENIPFKAHFDMMVAADIIEHVFNVGNFLLSANRALKMDGKFIVKTPYKENINSYSHYRGCKYQFVHLRNFNKELLTLLLRDAGFQIEKIHYDGFLSGEQYRRRYVNKLKPIKYLFEKIISKRYKNSIEVATIKNFWGKLFMRPYEITMVCRKVQEVIQ